VRSASCNCNCGSRLVHRALEPAVAGGDGAHRHGQRQRGLRASGVPEGSSLRPHCLYRLSRQRWAELPSDGAVQERVANSRSNEAISRDSQVVISRTRLSNLVVDTPNFSSSEVKTITEAFPERSHCSLQQLSDGAVDDRAGAGAPRSGAVDSTAPCASALLHRGRNDDLNLHVGLPRSQAPHARAGGCPDPPRRPRPRSCPRSGACRRSSRERRECSTCRYPPGQTLLDALEQLPCLLADRGGWIERPSGVAAKYTTPS